MFSRTVRIFTQSTFFIPTLANVSFAKKAGEYHLVFVGSLLIPCSLMFRVIVVDSNGNESASSKGTFQSSFNESVAAGTITGDLGCEDKGEEETTIGVVVVFDVGRAQEGKETEMVIVREGERRAAAANGLFGDQTQKVKGVMVVACVLGALLFLVCVVFVLHLVRERRMKGQMKAGAVFAKDVEMSESGRVQTEDAQSRERQIENVKLMKKYTDCFDSGDGEKSTDALLGAGVDTDKTQETQKDERKGREDEETHGGAEETEVMRKQDEPIETTSSIDNLVEGMSCESPFEKVIVDTRDSLYERLHHSKDPREKTLSIRDREIRAGRTLFWVAAGVEHLIEEGKYTEIAAALTSHRILFGNEGIVVLGRHLSVNQSKERANEHKTPNAADKKDLAVASYEANRWKAPELLADEHKTGDSATAVFSIGMILYEMVVGQVPFHGLDPITAGLKIAKGERPPLSDLRGTRMLDLVRMCWMHAPWERPSLLRLKQTLLSYLPEGSTQLTAPDPPDISNSEASEDGLPRPDNDKRGMGQKGEDSHAKQKTPAPTPAPGKVEAAKASPAPKSPVKPCADGQPALNPSSDAPIQKPLQPLHPQVQLQPHPRGQHPSRHTPSAPSSSSLHSPSHPSHPHSKDRPFQYMST